MTVTLVNGYVLISHPANWNSKPSAERNWETEIGEALAGAETRQANRSVSRRQVTFPITAHTLQERVRLEARLDAAKLSGLACAPMHGRACFLGPAVNAGANSLTLSKTAWTWAVGDYAILLSSESTFDVQQVNGLSNGGLTLGLAGNLTNAWSAGALVWPVIFGTLTSEKIGALNGSLAAVKVTIAELVSSRAVQIGNTPAVVPGIGQTKIGSTFKVS